MSDKWKCDDCADIRRRQGLDPFVGRSWKSYESHMESCPAQDKFNVAHGVVENADMIIQEDLKRRRDLGLPPHQDSLRVHDPVLPPAPDTEETFFDGSDYDNHDGGLALDDDVSAVSARSGGCNDGQNRSPKRVVENSQIVRVVERQNKVLSLNRPIEEVLQGYGDDGEELFQRAPSTRGTG